MLSITPTYTHLHLHTPQQVASDLSNIFMAHSTWDTFTAMLRIYKHYKFNLHDEYVVCVCVCVCVQHAIMCLGFVCLALCVCIGRS